MDANSEIWRLRTRPIDARTAARRYVFCPGALWAERDLPSRDIPRTRGVQGLDIEVRLARTAAATKALLRSAPVRQDEEDDGSSEDLARATVSLFDEHGGLAEGPAVGYLSAGLGWEARLDCFATCRDGALLLLSWQNRWEPAGRDVLIAEMRIGLCTVYRGDSSIAFVAIAQEDGFDIACFDDEAIQEAWKESVKWRARLLKNPATAPRVPSEQACAGCRARETYRCPETLSGSRDCGKGS